MIRKDRRFGICISELGFDAVPPYGEPINYNMTRLEAELALADWREHPDRIDGDGIVVERPAKYCVVNDGRVFQFDSAQSLETFMCGKDLRLFHTFVRFDSPSTDCKELSKAAQKAFRQVKR